MSIKRKSSNLRQQYSVSRMFRGRSANFSQTTVSTETPSQILAMSAGLHTSYDYENLLRFSMSKTPSLTQVGIRKSIESSLQIGEMDLQK